MERSEYRLGRRQERSSEGSRSCNVCSVDTNSRVCGRAAWGNRIGSAEKHEGGLQVRDVREELRDQRRFGCGVTIRWVSGIVLPIAPGQSVQVSGRRAFAVRRDYAGKCRPLFPIADGTNRVRDKRLQFWQVSRG